MADNNLIFKKYLRAQGLKYTPERQLVMQEAVSTPDHFEAEDLLLRIRNSGQRVSKGTIYRTLSLLVESGLVRQVVFTDKHTHYEHVYGHKHHEHLICTHCGKVIDFYRQGLEESLAEVCAAYGFSMKSHKIEVVGYCKKCKEAAK